MPVDPQLVELLRRVHAAPPLSSQSPEAARAAYLRLSQIAAGIATSEEVGSVEEIEVPGGAGPLPARVYRPDAERPGGPDGGGGRATIAFFHGGGFTIGDLDSHDAACRTLCRAVDAVVVATGYRLAPEHPFPAAAEDAVAATRWVLEHAAELGCDRARVAVAGDSAGGNLAAVAAQQLRGADPPIAAQLLIYPATDLVSERPSHRENGSGYFLTRDDIEWFHGNYLPDAGAGLDPLASPLNADDLSGLPPAIVATAEFDPLRDDGDAYAEALADAGVRVIHRRFDDQVHGFLGMPAFSTASDAAVRRLFADLRELLARTPSAPVA